MKMTRLLTYAVAGVIAGLLLENTILKVKSDAGTQGRKLKKKADELVKKADKYIHKKTAHA